MVVMSGDVGCWCALFGTLVGVSVLSVVVGVGECFGNQCTTMVVCVGVPECAFTSPVIIELGMLVMY